MHWPLIKNLPAHTHFNFVRWAPVAAGLSALLVIASIASFALQGLNLGTDFKGGTLVEITTPGPAPLGQLRASLGQMGVKDAEVQGFGSPNSASLRFEPNPAVPPAVAITSPPLTGSGFMKRCTASQTMAPEANTSSRPLIRAANTVALPKP